MSTIPEIEYLLDLATSKQGAANSKVREPIPVEKIDGVSDLVYGVFLYKIRGIGVPDRLLTPRFTRQPVLAVRKGTEFTPLAYAEDVINHPLRESLEGILRALSVQEDLLSL